MHCLASDVGRLSSITGRRVGGGRPHSPGAWRGRSQPPRPGAPAEYGLLPHELSSDWLYDYRDYNYD